MEKSKIHFRAAHPLLFISIILFSGIVSARYYLSNYYTMPLELAMGILLISLLILQYLQQKNQKSNSNNFIVSLYNFIIILFLYTWGIILFYIHQKNNTLSIPYPKDFIQYCRNAVIQKINNSIYFEQANAFAKALLLGVKMEKHKDIISAYQQLGIIHIIAISGMHLEIIFKNISRITMLLPRHKIGRYLELLIVLSSVWIYTLMAFASPSIVRAATFFCIYYVGLFIEASSFTLNTIAAAVLVVFLFDLNNIENIGLQLSYAAVVGIHLFFPVLHKMLPMENKVLVFLWSNLCVSLAAQITTLPILLFHFHQIASLVLISNFIMVPLSTLLLYALILLLLSPSIVGIHKFLGAGIEKYIIAMNNAIRFLNSLPINRSIEVSLNMGQIIFYYMGLGMIYAWLQTKKAKWLLYTLGLGYVYFLLKLFSLV